MKTDNYLCIDIGGTNIKYAILNNAGNIIQNDKVKSMHDKKIFLNQIDKIINQYKGVKGIAFCAPGKVYDNTIYFGGSLPFLDGINFSERYKDLKTPISIINDGKASVLAENWLGSLKYLDNCAAITLGTGLGGGIVVNGRLLSGVHAQAGEVSFMKLTDQEDVDKIAGLQYSAVQMIKEINKNTSNDSEDGLGAFKLINEKNSDALKIFNKFCYGVATVILNIQTVVDLEKYAIGGGISAQPVLIDGINKAYQRLIEKNSIISKMLTKPEIVSAKFKNNANLFGALYNLLLNENNETL
ncbi:ROK family protein [Lactobacillus johnsonii]|uniref:ROK family protein n=1 Tax=Lactobacillus johnsonii TaxID=33959 RepID=UPI0014765E0E|nr:ROK family protein [Lactobacillus johnsonii]NME20343.1 ROK family protein [Lactobacillus johnsonii]